MDIERMKKINSMIPELKRQGFAVNSADAALQSDQIFRNQDEYSVIQDTANVLTTPTSTANPLPPPTPVAQSPESIAQVKAMEHKLGAMEERLSILMDKMNEMISVITELEKFRDHVKSTQPRETQQTIPTPKKEEKAEQKEGHVRSGNYTSADVDIHKMFYYGNK
ncbi:MAG TPA: hypothetical protein VJ044_03470 [Candidatus Hodarchaeales archaeon]|nr:hypothetical protein [Candidatus Hodarchaeales archaeon]